MATVKNSDKTNSTVSNKFFTRFAAMRSNGPDPKNFMRCQRLFWVLIWSLLAMPSTMELILGDRCALSGPIETHILIASICGARLLLFIVAWIIDVFYYYEFLTEEVFQSFIWALFFEGTLIGVMVYGKKKFFETKIIFE